MPKLLKYLLNNYLTSVESRRLQGQPQRFLGVSAGDSAPLHLILQCCV